jgi:hypothetical protein
MVRAPRNVCSAPGHGADLPRSFGGELLEGPWRYAGQRIDLVDHRHTAGRRSRRLLHADLRKLVDRVPG